MIKITYNSNDTYINDYVLSKQIEELGISTTCNTNVRFEKPTFNDLLQSTLVGADADDIDIEITCGGATEQFDAYIDHREGKFNLKTCVADKKINFKVPYECLRTSNGNIFHSKPKVTKTIQGTLIRESYTGITHVTYPDDYTPTLQEMISLFPIPIKPDFHAEYMDVSADPIIEYIKPDGGGYAVPTYMGHKVDIYIRYVKFRSLTKPNNDWIPDPGGGYYLNPDTFQQIEWEIFDQWVSQAGVFHNKRNYNGVKWRAGRFGVYIDEGISNTYSLNEVLEDMFLCTGISLSSDFLGINPIGDSPTNKEYEYSYKYLQELMIVQSFDVIRASAMNDSSGDSGVFESSKLLNDITKLFNLVLFYDEVNNLLRLEHVTFLNYKGLDLDGNNYDYEFSGELVANQQEINKEIWLMAGESDSYGFYRTEIDYKNYDINRRPNERSTKMDYIITDLADMLNNEDYNKSNYQKMFFLLATSGGEVIGYNNPLSIRELVKNLHPIGRPSKNGWLDGKRTTFLGYSVGLEGEIKWSGSITMFRKLTPLNSLKTKFGTFMVTEMSIERDIITFKIKK